MTNKTPFDDLISEYWTVMISTIPENLSSNFQVVFSWLKILRVVYLQMKSASDEFHQGIEDMRSGPQGTRTQTPEETLQQPDKSIACKLSYFQFIDQLNRTGRVLKDKGYDLPFYPRIYFFRNKIVEHWDDYIQFFSNTADGLIFQQGKIPIPYHMGSIHFPAQSKRAQNLIRSEFAKFGVKRIILKDKWYADYSENIFKALEKIDPVLGRGINEPITESLFRYSFPTPITDIETYCDELVGWINDKKADIIGS